MRAYIDLGTCIRETHRDLYKAPRVPSSRVQHLMGDFMTGEASPYAFTVRSSGMPETPEELFELGNAHFDWWKESKRSPMISWLNAELADRVQTQWPIVPTEPLHPELVAMREGNHYGYTYAERTVQMVEIMSQQLLSAPDTRRCFWPIFHPIDAIRANSPTRVPCTLGYQAQIRFIKDRPVFEFTIISRSVDFDKFWISDLWFAYKIGNYICDGLKPRMDGLKYGNVTHHILSFHRFIDEAEETY